MDGKLRIINTKTGQVRFVEKHIANNEKLLKQYGYVKQDLQEEKIPIVAQKVETKEDAHVLDTVLYREAPSFEPETFEEKAETLREQYERVIGKKAGNKSESTMLKEIQDKQTI